MRRRILTVEYDAVETLAKALASPVRRQIINTLTEGEQSIQELANHLGIPQSTCTVNVQMLERTGIIATRNEPGTKGSRKMCSVAYDEAIVPIHGRHQNLEDTSIEIEMPIGLYTDYDIEGPCGIVSEAGVIGRFDHVESFLDPHHGSAQLIWFTDGWLEYSFPIEIPPQHTPTAVTMSMELCSEFPGYKNSWPSDIAVWIGGLEIGTWRSPGDMGGKRGQLTPSWWSLDNTQFGYLKEWRITADGSYLDGVRAGDVTITDLDLASRTKITARVGIAPDAEFHGGINLFGRHFGNSGQDIMLRIELA
jgi:predicted transcriptional regulator